MAARSRPTPAAKSTSTTSASPARSSRTPAQIDAEEDERFGDRRGDELPPEVSTHNGRQQWFKEAKRRLDDQRAAEGAPIPRERAKRLREAKRRLDEQLWTEARANDAYLRFRAGGKDHRGWRLGPGTTPKPYTPPEVPPGVINTTDLDSRMVKGQHGFLQGYNAQAAANEHQIVIAAEIEVVSPDFGHLERTIAAARRELTAAGVTELPQRRCRGLRLLAHPADPTAHRRRHPGPDPARIRPANHAQAGLARRDL